MGMNFRNAHKLALVVPFLGLVFLTSLQAQVEIEIIAGEGSKIPITIMPFEGSSEESEVMAEIISNNLIKTGLFSVRPNDDGWERVSKVERDRYDEWSARQVQNLVVGKFSVLDDGRIEVLFRLYDVPGESQSIGRVVKDAPRQIRQVAHYFSDLIYEKLTGDQGVFRTKLAYVIRTKKESSLVIADSDGYDAKSVYSSKEPILSPSWSPDGKKLAFVSFNNRRAAIYVLPINIDYRKGRVSGGGVPTIIGPFPGSNSAPAWSPDGQSLAIAISKDGKSNIFIVRVDDPKNPFQVTNGDSINTEPSYSKDGDHLVFTSDKSGRRPQVYQVPVNGGKEIRLTYTGRYNASAEYSNDGSFIALINNDEGLFNVATHDVRSGTLQILTRGSLDQSPSIAPNGKVIVYASERGGRGILRFVSKNGRARLLYRGPMGDLREPAWGPLIEEEE